MDRKTESWNVALAAAFGATIGGLIAIGHGTALAIVGVVVGALSGYMSFEWRRVVRAIPHAWRAANRIEVSLPSRRVVIGVVRELGHRMLYASMIVNWFEVIVVAVYICFHFPWPSEVGLKHVFALHGGCTVFLWMLFSNPHEDEFTEVFPPRSWYLYSPFVVLPKAAYYIVLWAVMTTVSAFVAVFYFVPFLGRFGKSLFVRVHSDARLTAGAGALFGTLFGIILHQVPMCTIAGFVLAFVEHRFVAPALERRGMLPTRR